MWLRGVSIVAGSDENGRENQRAQNREEGTRIIIQRLRRITPSVRVVFRLAVLRMRTTYQRTFDFCALTLLSSRAARVRSEAGGGDG